MVPIQDLLKISQARLEDAEVLLAAARFDGGIYLCGYAVEIALKARICQTLNWPGYPSTRKEFEGYQSFRTHDLDILLHLSGAETTIKTKNLAQWSIVATWDPNVRYRPVGAASPQEARDMVNSTKALLTVI